MVEVVSPYQRASGRRVFLTTVFATFAVALAFVVQYAGINRALGDSGRTDATMATEYPLLGPDPGDEPAPSALYAGVMWSVLGVDVTPSDSFLRPSTVNVHLQVRNTLARTPLRVSDSLLSLTSSTGSTTGGALFTDAGRRVALDPGQARDLTASFSVGTSTPDPATLSLQIGELNHVPAVIPLVGPAPAQPAAATVGIDHTHLLLPDPDNANRQIVVEPVGAAIGVEAGPYRANASQRLAVVKVDVQRASIGPTSGFLSTAYWALRSSAGDTPAVLVAQGSTFGDNANELTLLFVFPADAHQLSVVAAAGRPEAATITLNDPAGPAPSPAAPTTDATPAAEPAAAPAADTASS